MNRQQLVVCSERRGYWASQLRARLWDRPATWREARGTADLISAASGWPCPIVVLDLGTNPEAGLDRLGSLSAYCPDALILALDPGGLPEVERTARVLGASIVWSGFAPPPAVASLVSRWIALARQRTSRAGRAALPEPEAEPADPIATLGL
jgi:hypothetical protein